MKFARSILLHFQLVKRLYIALISGVADDLESKHIAEDLKDQSFNRFYSLCPAFAVENEHYFTESGDEIKNISKKDVELVVLLINFFFGLCMSSFSLFYFRNLKFSFRNAQCPSKMIYIYPSIAVKEIAFSVKAGFFIIVGKLNLLLVI